MADLAVSTEKDLENLDQKGLEDFLKQDDTKIIENLEKSTSKETFTPSEPKTTPPPTVIANEKTTPAPTAYEYEIDVGDGRKYQFKNKDEFVQSFRNAQQAIAELNGKWGKANQQLARTKQLEDQYNQSQRMIEELRRGQVQISQGQAPTAISQQTADASGLNDNWFEDLTVDNFKDKIKDLATVIEHQVDNRYSKQFAELAEKNKHLEEQFGKIYGDITYKEGLVNFEAHRNKLFTEVQQLQNDPMTNGMLKTQWSLDKINEVLTQNPGVAADGVTPLASLMIPPGDYEKAGHIMEILKYYCPTDADGEPVVSERKMKSIRAAYAAYNVDANLNSQDIASAHVAGQNSALEAMARVANQPPTLPNTTTQTTGLSEMTVEQATELINTDPMTVQKWQTSAPKKYRRYMKAQELISQLP
jgi:hypothetical protein